MANCTKEYSKQLVEKYWEREWVKIKQIDFPKTREHEITEDSCIKELSNLKNTTILVMDAIKEINNITNNTNVF